MYHYKNFFLIILSLILPAVFLSAQPLQVKFDNIGIEQGLSQSTVYAIAQDKQGFIWFGTQDGLNRYDGYSVKVFKHNPGDINSISDNTIWSLLSGKRGDLWIATMRGGVDRYVLSENKFYHYTYKEDDPFSVSENDVTTLFEDSNGQIWMGTRSKGLNRFDPKSGKFTHYQLNNSGDKNAKGIIWAICEDINKNLWVGASTGLYKANLNSPGIKFTSYTHNPEDPSSISLNHIRSLYCDRNGILWIGTWGGGLNRLDISSAGKAEFKHYLYNSKELNSVIGNAILSIYEDTKGILWIASYDMGLMTFDRGKGVFNHYSGDALSLFEDRAGILWVGTIAEGVMVYDRHKMRFRHYCDDPDNPNDMNGSDVVTLFEDNGGGVWAGTDGSGLNYFPPPGKNGRDGKVINYNVKPGDAGTINSNKIYAVCQSQDGKIWIGTKGGGLNLFDKGTGKFKHYKHNPANSNSLSSDEVMSLCKDHNGMLWIGNNSGGIDLFNPAKNTFTHYSFGSGKKDALAGVSVLAIYEDKNNRIWVGTTQRGLFRYIPGTDSFKNYPIPAGKRRSSGGAAVTNNYNVFSIYQDSKGFIWIGTFGNGLIRLNPENESYKFFTEREGLPNEVVYGILPDNAGNLWLSTNKGISKFNLAKETFRNFDVRDGLQSNEFNQGAFFASRSGELFFGGVKGFNAFFPWEIKDNSYIPPVYITTFKVFDEVLPIPNSVSSAKQIELSYAQNFFSFEFVALNYTSPEKNMYAYMLEGFDKNWHIVPAQQRYASYTNLDPGRYILHIKAANNDGVWNKKGTSIIIIVTPPFWTTWWFQLLLALTLVGILFLIYRYRVAKLLEIERIRSSIAVDLHDDIGSTLTEIALYSDLSLREMRTDVVQQALNGKHHKVESLLENIGITSRRLIDAMNDIVWAVDPKNDSFEFLLLRMKTQAARMFDAKQINYEIDIPEELSSLRLPLVFRRNLYLIFKEAVNNIIRHAHPNKAVVKIRKAGSSLVMTITDDGVGFDTSVSYDGNGLNNMKKRAAFINGGLTVTSGKNKETQIKLTANLP